MIKTLMQIIILEITIITTASYSPEDSVAPPLPQRQALGCNHQETYQNYYDFKVIIMMIIQIMIIVIIMVIRKVSWKWDGENFR